jgi:Na+-transporting NADH:ubiquinone oxidoreductase subunit C
MSDQKRQNKLRRSLFTIFFMFAVTLVFISVLSLIYVLTRDIIRLNESLVVKRAVLYVAGLEVPQTGIEADALYQKQVREVKDEGGNVLYYEILEPSGTNVQS